MALGTSIAEADLVEVLCVLLTASFGVAATLKWRDRWWSYPMGALALAFAIGWFCDRNVIATMLVALTRFLEILNERATPYLGLVAVVAGGAAAWGAVSSLNRAALDTAAEAFLQLRAKYHSDEMRSAIELLVDFAYPIKKSVIGEWNRALRSDAFGAVGELLRPALEGLEDGRREKLKSAARKVTGYFDDVGFLFKHKIIRGREMKLSFVDVPGLNVFYEVCVPMYSLKNRNSPSISYALLLRRTLEKHGEGMMRY